jgi:hypothetical protein
MTGFPCPFCQTLRPPPTADEPACPTCRRTAVVCGDYRITALLGRGGMGVVYGGERIADQRPVAIKMLALQFGADWKGHELFERSTRVLQDLHHRSLPGIFAFEKDDAGRLVLVRERFDGDSLEERIVAQRRLGSDQLHALLVSMLELLAYLHGRVPPVLHRDIKASNIMFRTRADWDPVLVDFDTVAVPGTQIKRTTLVVSPGYTAPEQLEGKVSPASDLFSLGATMLFAATQTHPDELPARDGRFLVADRLGPLDQGLQHVLLKLVEPEVAQRYARAEDALRDLREGPPAINAVPGAAPAPAPTPLKQFLGQVLGRQPEPVRPPAPSEIARPVPARPPVPAPTPKPKGPILPTVIGWLFALFVTGVIVYGTIMGFRSTCQRNQEGTATPERRTAADIVSLEQTAKAYEEQQKAAANPPLPVRATHDLRDKLLWRFTPDAEPIGAPQVVGNDVLVADKVGILYALDRATGRERWRHETREAARAPIATRDGALWFCNGAIHVLDTADGGERTEIPAGDDPAAWLAVEGDLAFTLTEKGWLRAYAFPDAGEPRWQLELRGPAVAAGGRFGKLERTGAIVAVATDNGYLQAVDPASGKEVWRIPPGEGGSLGLLSSGEHLFVVSGRDDAHMDSNGGIYNWLVVQELDLGSGVEQWRLGAPLHQGPYEAAADGERVLIASLPEEGVMALHALRSGATQDVVSRASWPGAQITSVRWTSGLLALTESSNVHLWDVDRGDEIVLVTDLPWSKYPAIIDGTLYLVASMRDVCAFDVRSVPELAPVRLP